MTTEGTTGVAPVARERRHTLRFLEEIRSFSPVFLDTEVDMTRVRAHQAAARAGGVHLSTVTYLLFASARVLARHPQANAAIRGRLRPRVARYHRADGKVTFDKTMNGKRVVLSTVIPELDRTGLEDIQHEVERFRDGDPATMPEFAGTRLLQRLPVSLAALVFRLRVRPLRRRASVMGTFAVTSLGHRPVDGFHSVGGTTVTLGAGQIADRPVVRDGTVVVAPTMRLSLTFDHRVIDGAEAADVLAEIRDALQSFQATPIPTGSEPAQVAPAASGAV
jgi:pyruvate/2-oxoglutarate dehydrogenase complex dihydrolipoamide acyltransferase (E2) component